MRRFRLALLPFFLVQHALAQSADTAKPDAPPSAPAEDETGDVSASDAEAPDGAPAPAPKKPPPKPAEPPADDAANEQALDDAALEAELDGPDLKKAPPKGMGALVGVVTDTKFHEPLVEAQVEIIGFKKRVFTDVEGRFRVDLPPGTYTVRAAYELHKSSRAEGVRVVVGKFERLNLELVPDESAVDEVVIETEFEHTSSEGRTLERKRSAVVGDGVGRADIARTPDRNAAEAAQRVVGATIVGGRFVYVRGLGERYTNALLNGTPLPSPEPDRQTVPLDLFPSLILDSVTIVKQFTPDFPADFAGGSVRIRTREFPRETLFQVSLNAGYNTETTFQDRPDYHGGSTDGLGFDDGDRQLPEGIPHRQLDEDDTVPWGQRMNSYLSTLRAGTPPNYGLSVVAGDSWKPGKDVKLGGIAALNYSRTYQHRHYTTVRNYKLQVQPDESQVMRVSDDFQAEHGIDSVRWGAFGSAAVELTPKHKLTLTGIHSQSADDRTMEFMGGYDTTKATPSHVTHLEYVSRALDYAQLSGHHELDALNAPVIDWFGAIAVASRDQPDTRDLRYDRLLDTHPSAPGWHWLAGPESPGHFYSDQGETTYNAGLDLTQTIFKFDENEQKLKLGGLVNLRSREFSARRFTYETVRGMEVPDQRDICAGEEWTLSCPDRLFTNDLIDGESLVLEENTLKFDEYEAELNVYAAYAMVDLQPVKAVRVVGGARVEVTNQGFVAYVPFDHDSPETERSTIESTDVLPALSVVYTTTQKTNLRFGLSQTLARPQLREITPFLSNSYTAEYSTQGNPNLKLTRITNADLRFEFFPTLREVAAFSFFYKHFKDPIEEVIIVGSSSGIQSFANANAADLIGLELEARKTLGFLAPVLDDFTAIANLTLAHSAVDPGEAAGAATNPYRPLSYQSPYVVNLALDYSNTKSGTDVRLLYNVLGPRIVSVGVLGMPDVYELSRHLLDASVAQKISKKFDIKLNVQNLLAAPVVFAYKDAVAYVPGGPNGAYVPGEKDPVKSRYQPGVTFTLSGTYTY